MLLSILLPTYNRSRFLLKNLELLSKHIKFINATDLIEIIISNNNSPDDTEILCKEFISKEKTLNIKYYNQEENIGLEENALYVLSKSKADYVMYLGDDDYIDLKYLEGLVNLISSDKEISTIIPSFYPIDIEEKRSGTGRDVNFKNKMFNPGFNNCLVNSYRGHQLSGLVLEREGLYEEYRSNNVNNIYLFIYFVSYNCLRGKTFHFTEFPVKVTSIGQQSKDWGYGDDGLINEVFDNYKKLNISLIKKTKLQLKFYKEQTWRLLAYKNNGFKSFILAFLKFWFAKNGTILFKLIFPLLFLKIEMKKKFKKL